MGKIKIRDEQKGIIFIAIIFIIVIGLTIFFSLTLRTNVVKEYIKDNDVLRTLFVVEDDDNSVLFLCLLIYVPETQKAAFINFSEQSVYIYESLGSVDFFVLLFFEG